MIPSSFIFIDEIPLTRNGKIDTAALPRPDGAHARATWLADATPLTESEHRVAEVNSCVCVCLCVRVH